MSWKEHQVSIPEGESGPWKVEKFIVSKEDESFGRMRSMFGGMSRGRYVPAGEYTRLTRNGMVIMSDTPDEIRDHRAPMMQSKHYQGPALVHGLGLGIVSRAMLRNGVEHVTVVDLSPDVIWLVGSSLIEEFGDRVTIIEDNALTWKPPKGIRYGVVWHDIWDNICADNLEDMKKLHRRFGRRAEWQGSWCRDMCEDYRRRSR